MLLDGRLTVHPLDRAAPGRLAPGRARTDSAAAVAAVLATTSGIVDVGREAPSGDLAAWRVRAVDRMRRRVVAKLCSARLPASSGWKDVHGGALLRLTRARRPVRSSLPIW